MLLAPTLVQGTEAPAQIVGGRAAEVVGGGGVGAGEDASRILEAHAQQRGVIAAGPLGGAPGVRSARFAGPDADDEELYGRVRHERAFLK